MEAVGALRPGVTDSPGVDVIMLSGDAGVDHTIQASTNLSQ